jgi:hypothetical protein
MQLKKKGKEMNSNLSLMLSKKILIVTFLLDRLVITVWSLLLYYYLSSHKLVYKLLYLGSFINYFPKKISVGILIRQ